MTRETAKATGAMLVSKDQLFERADILTIHLVLSSRTRGLVGAAELERMKPTARLIGPIVEELVRTGTSRYLEDLRKQFPPGIFELLRVPGLGLKKIGQIYSELGIASIDELEAAGRAGRLAKLRGFGAKTQQKILEGIGFARTATTPLKATEKTFPLAPRTRTRTDSSCCSTARIAPS